MIRGGNFSIACLLCRGDEEYIYPRECPTVKQPSEQPRNHPLQEAPSSPPPPAPSNPTRTMRLPAPFVALLSLLTLTAQLCATAPLSSTTHLRTRAPPPPPPLRASEVLSFSTVFERQVSGIAALIGDTDPELTAAVVALRATIADICARYRPEEMLGEADYAAFVRGLRGVDAAVDGFVGRGIDVGGRRPWIGRFY
ncbi:MAG: hypothetical protein M1829_006201 [Trizodia sp. TS-e1964]|nr:MAG: hypothetical protein M1829_006201 [Trizodia sp. TS-e1964]